MNRDIKKAESIIELKDGRSLIKFDNGFTYYIQSKKGIMDEVTEEYYKEILRKNRITKKTKKLDKAI